MSDEHMHLRIEGDLGVAYLHLRPTAVIDHTVEINCGILVDVDDQGQAVGVELLNRGSELPTDELIKRFDLDESHLRLLRRVALEITQLHLSTPST